MRLITSKSPFIKPKMEDLIDKLIVVKVLKFDDDAVKAFFDSMQEAFSAAQPVVPIVIDTYGGGIYDLLAMVDIVKSSPKPVATIAMGKTMSAGAVLFSFGTKGYRYAAPTSTFLIHEVSSWASGKVKEITSDAKEVERLNDLVLRAMATNSGKKPNYFLDKIHERNHADWFMTAKQAKEEGLADHVGVPTLSVRVEAKYSFGMGKGRPKKAIVVSNPQGS